MLILELFGEGGAVPLKLERKRISVAPKTLNLNDF